MLPDIVLFPSCDLHVALNGGAPPLNVRVMFREHHAPPDLSYRLTPVTALCQFDFFAPHLDPGHRLDNLPSVNLTTGRVTATTPGIYLFQVRFGSIYLVGRLQVHDRILDWWFGNDSLTAAVDPAFAHTQPSIYASFSADPARQDIVGDITGHGYVALTPSDPTLFTVNPDGRLQALKEGAGTVSGTFAGGAAQTLAVTCVDYAKTRNTLDLVRLANLDTPGDMHNMLFIGEGFRETVDDRKLFDEIVTKTANDLFSKPRHEPFPLLGKSFNVWKTYQASAEHGITAGYRVNDDVPAGGNPQRGSPIPFSRPRKDPTKYTSDALIRIVGLPRDSEPDTLTTLVNRWNGQSLDGFEAARVDQTAIDAWKTQRTASILQTRDSFFGFRFGTRPGERDAINTSDDLTPPTQDATTDLRLKPFIKRLYEFFDMGASRVPALDPRRHAPEVLANAGEHSNPGTPFTRYLASLCWKFPPNPPIGREWEPNPLEAAPTPPPNAFKRSRGLVALIINDGLDGGAAVNALTATAITIGSDQRIEHTIVVTGNIRRMRRTMPPAFPPNIDSCINTIAHEFGHSFGLDDEYEEFDGNDPAASRAREVFGDNVTSLGAIFNHGTVTGGVVTFADEQVSPDKVKWLVLPRIKLASAATVPSIPFAGLLRVIVDLRLISAWTAAKNDGLRPSMRARVFSTFGGQLPFASDATVFLENLNLDSVDEATGVINLTGGAFPAAGAPLLEPGAVLYVPRLVSGGAVARVIEKKVLDAITARHVALNKDAQNAFVSKETDEPFDIAGYSAPCDAYKVIGLYEGAGRWSGRKYRPAGSCKMRTEEEGKNNDGQFCYVCKWLIVNRVDPSLHGLLEDKFYPNAKKGGDA